MNTRETKEYKEMTNYNAVAIAEGFEGADSEQQVIAAWQFIIDKRLYMLLQDWFGRTTEWLIENGICEPELEKIT